MTEYERDKATMLGNIRQAYKKQNPTESQQIEDQVQVLYHTILNAVSREKNVKEMHFTLIQKESITAKAIKSLSKYGFDVEESNSSNLDKNDSINFVVSGWYKQTKENKENDNEQQNS